MSQTIYVVSDVGAVSPCMGIIFGAFATESEAKALQTRIESNPEAWGLWDFDDKVCVHELVLGQVVDEPSDLSVYSTRIQVQ